MASIGDADFEKGPFETGSSVSGIRLVHPELAAVAAVCTRHFGISI